MKRVGTEVAWKTHWGTHVIAVIEHEPFVCGKYCETSNYVLFMDKRFIICWAASMIGNIYNNMVPTKMNRKKVVFWDCCVLKFQNNCVETRVGFCLGWSWFLLFMNANSWVTVSTISVCSFQISWTVNAHMSAKWNYHQKHSTSLCEVARVYYYPCSAPKISIGHQ